MSKKYLVIVQATTKELFGWITNKYNHTYNISAENEKEAKKLAISNCAQSNKYTESFDIISCVESIESKLDKEAKYYYVGVSANISYLTHNSHFTMEINSNQQELKEPIQQYVCQEIKFVDLKDKSEDNIKEYAIGKFKEFVTRVYLKETENNEIKDITVNYIK